MAELITTSLFRETTLKAYYRCESGVLTIDSSGNGYTLTNNNTVGEATGKYGIAADLGASNSNKYLSVANNFGIDGGVITMNLWFRTASATQAGDHPALAALYSGNTKTEYGITIGGVGITGWRLKAGTAYQETTAVVISANTWYMATLTYDASYIRFYLNTVLVGGPTAASGNGADTQSNLFTIGRRADTTAIAYQSGYVDDVVVSNTVFKGTQIEELYNDTVINYIKGRPRNRYDLSGVSLG